MSEQRDYPAEMRAIWAGAYDFSPIERAVLREYERTAEPVGDSDLYGEQPRTLTVSFTLGDLRKLRSRAWAQAARS